jgi:hypothetical protein
MHRSGTSAATRMINMLGLPTCRQSDLFESRLGNERGYWESASLTGFNEHLLAKLGGAWWCPPPLQVHGEIASRLSTERNAGLALLRTAHPTAHWVWKDPRNCVLLPFWRNALDGDPVVVLTLRNVVDVCASLARRSELTLDWSLALCERYLGHALRALTGLPVLCARYEDLVDDPHRWSQQAGCLLSRVGVDINRLPSAEITAFVEPRLEHSRHLDDEMYCLPLPSRQRDLFRVTFGLASFYESFPDLTLPEESLSTTETLARVANSKDRTRPPARLKEDGTKSSDSCVARREPSAPEVCVVLSLRPGSVGPTRTLLGLLATMPATGQIFVVGRGADRLVEHLSRACSDAATLIAVSEEAAGPRAQRLAASRTQAPFLAFTTTFAQPHPLWADSILLAFADPHVGAAGPVLRSTSPEGGFVHGLTLEDDALNTAWLRGTPSGITDVPFLTGHFMVIRTSAVSEAGGLDDEMADAGVWDLELCLRLWRAGYRVVSVPDSVVTYDFEAAVAPDPCAFRSNLLRFATLHFEEDLLRAVVRRLDIGDEFPAAVSHTLLGDSGIRRRQYDASLTRTTAQFIAQFGLEHKAGIVGPLTAAHAATKEW